MYIQSRGANHLDIPDGDQVVNLYVVALLYIENSLLAIVGPAVDASLVIILKPSVQSSTQDIDS
jgi:hypothetical protein